MKSTITQSEHPKGLSRFRIVKKASALKPFDDITETKDSRLLNSDGHYIGGKHDYLLTSDALEFQQTWNDYSLPLQISAVKKEIITLQHKYNESSDKVSELTDFEDQRSLVRSLSSLENDLSLIIQKFQELNQRLDTVRKHASSSTKNEK